MKRLSGGMAALVAIGLVISVSVAAAQGPPAPWDGVNPFNCVLQQAGSGATVPNPEADPFCIEFDKTEQNVTELGLLEFLGNEPARVAAAAPKCFYFQSDHWRGSIAQDQAATKTYEWDGHYFFNRATGDGGVWVTNFNFGGFTGDPRELPGFPEEYKPFFGPGEGGFRTHNSVPVEERCVELAERLGPRLYSTAGRASRCVASRGRVTSRALGAVALRSSESEVRARLGSPRGVRRGYLRYCVQGGGRFLVGQREDRSGDFGAGTTERSVFLLTSAKGYRYRRVGPGMRLRTLRRRLRRARRLTRVGRTVIYAPRPRSRVLFGVRRKRVTFVALRDRSVLRRRATIRAYVRRTR